MQLTIGQLFLLLVVYIIFKWKITPSMDWKMPSKYLLYVQKSRPQFEKLVERRASFLNKPGVIIKLAKSKTSKELAEQMREIGMGPQQIIFVCEDSSLKAGEGASQNERLNTSGRAWKVGQGAPERQSKALDQLLSSL